LPNKLREGEKQTFGKKRHNGNFFRDEILLLKLLKKEIGCVGTIIPPYRLSNIRLLQV